MEFDREYDTPFDEVSRPYMGTCQAPLRGIGRPEVLRPNGTLAVPAQIPSRHHHAFESCDLWRVPRPDPDVDERYV